MFVLNGNQKKILKYMRRCGLNEYESKAYTTLLISGESRAWDLYKRSSVPHSKIYSVVEELKKKRLVDVKEERPITIVPKNFSTYLRNTIREKENEIKSIQKFGCEMDKLIKSLKPITTKFKRYKVFEPKFRQR